MDYDELTKYITTHNSEICHITTWQTWKELNQENLPILFELIGMGLCSGMSNEELYRVYTDIWRNREEIKEALDNKDEEYIKKFIGIKPA